jgi:hypothetical protein
MQQETDSLVAFLFSLFPNSQSHRKDKSNQCKKKTTTTTKNTITIIKPLGKQKGETWEDYLYRPREKEKSSLLTAAAVGRVRVY